MQPVQDVNQTFEMLKNISWAASTLCGIVFLFHPPARRGWRFKAVSSLAVLLVVAGVAFHVVLVPGKPEAGKPEAGSQEAGKEPRPAPSAPAPTLLDALAAAKAHLDAPGVVARRVRFLTLTHLEGGEADAVRHAVLARWPGATSLGAPGCVVAVDPAALDWDRLTRGYPYGLRLEDGQDARVATLAADVVRRTGDDLPFLRADRAVGRPGGPVSLAVAAREFGLPADGLRHKLAGARQAGSAQAATLLDGGEVPRAAWESLAEGISPFQRLARELELGTPLGRAGLALR